MTKESQIVTATNTRPANTTQYTANDAVSDSASSPSALTFSNVARLVRGGGRLVDVTLIGSANQATKPELELYLFTQEPTPTNDNAEFALSHAQALTCCGVVQFATTDFVGLDPTAGADGNMFGRPTTRPDYPFRCADGDQDLYGLLKVTNAYTPVSGEVWTVNLHVEQD